MKKRSKRLQTCRNTRKPTLTAPTPPREKLVIPNSLCFRPMTLPALCLNPSGRTSFGALFNESDDVSAWLEEQEDFKDGVHRRDNLVDDVARNCPIVLLLSMQQRIVTRELGRCRNQLYGYRIGQIQNPRAGDSDTSRRFLHIFSHKAQAPDCTEPVVVTLEKRDKNADCKAGFSRLS